MSDLKKANEMLKSGRYPEALGLYEKIRLENPSLYDYVGANVKFAQSKIKGIKNPNIEKEKPIEKKLTPVDNKNIKIGVVLHVYHQEVVGEILDKLKLIKSKFELFITTPLEASSYSIKEIIESFPQARYFKTPNKGRDVLPFFKIYNEFEHCDVVLKIHTKKGVTNYGDLWRGLSLESLLFSSQYIQEILGKFRTESEVVIAGPEIFYGSGRRLMYGNHENIIKICKNIGIEYKESSEWGFFAGTMFWFRPQIFKSIASCIGKLDFGKEQGNLDGGTEHALERMFGLLPSYAKNQALLLSGGKQANSNDSSIKVIELPGSPAGEEPTKLINEFAKKTLSQMKIFGDINKQTANSLTDMKVRGWLAKRGDESPREFVLKIGDVEVEGVASRYRQDLEEHKLNKGCHAFEVKVPLKFATGKEVNITIFDKVTGLPVAANTYKWNLLSREYDDFAGYLAWAYNNQYVEVPFTEPDKRAFSVMEVIANWLEKTSLADSYRPLISVIMPAFNRETVISVAIDSVICQSYENWELIVVDDGSSDGTPSVIKNYSDKRLKFFQLEENVGVSAARNFALSQASGQYVAYLDTDNSWDKRFLSVTHAVISKYRNIDAFYSGQIIYSGSTRELEGIRFGPFNKSLLMNNNYIDLNCFVHKAEIEKFDRKFNTNLPRFVDWEFITRLSVAGSICSIPVILSNYNLGLVGNTITGNGKLIVYLDQVREIININLNHSLQSKRLAEDNKNLRISVVIPSFNALEDLKECITSLTPYVNYSDFEIIVVDNASSQDVAEYLESCVAQYPSKFKLTKLDKNYGYTYAVNRGIELAHEDNDILLLNNDAVLTMGSLEILQKTLHSSDEYGIAAPAQILPANTETISVHVPYAVADVEVDVNVSTHHKNLKNIPLFYDGSPLVVDFVPFFCVLIKRSTISMAGTLDHRNGRHYRSDRTYCSYVRSMFGLQVVYVPQSLIYHKLQKSTKQLNAVKDKNSGSEFDLIFKENSWSDSDQLSDQFKVSAWNKRF